MRAGLRSFDEGKHSQVINLPKARGFRAATPYAGFSLPKRLAAPIGILFVLGATSFPAAWMSAALAQRQAAPTQITPAQAQAGLAACRHIHDQLVSEGSKGFAEFREGAFRQRQDALTLSAANILESNAEYTERDARGTPRYGLNYRMLYVACLDRARAAQIREHLAREAASHSPPVLPTVAPVKQTAGVSDAEELKARAEQGEAAAQYALAELFAQGKGLDKDPAQAASWYRRAADEGYGPAQLALGLIYEQGIGVVKDLAEAALWFLRAAQQGNAEAQVNLGNMYESGKGVAQDAARAVEWYRRAADQGYARGQTNLGYMYDEGRGVGQDYKQAARLYRLAAEQGEATAQNNLGLLYLDGLGVARDYAEAERWFRRALQTDPSNNKAANNLKTLEQKTLAASGSSASPTPAPSGSVAGGLCRSVDDFSDRFERITVQYPRRAHWGSRDTFLHTAFVLQRAIEVLNSCGAGLSRADFDTNMNGLVRARDAAIRGCEQISTNYASCRPIYPN